LGAWVSKGQRSLPLVEAFPVPKAIGAHGIGIAPFKAIVFSLVLPKVLAYTPA
jgi:hypothetical protein